MNPGPEGQPEMDHDPGEEYDCDACGGSHEVREGKGVRVAGSAEELPPSVYVRCPEAGVISLSTPESSQVEDGEDWP